METACKHPCEEAGEHTDAKTVMFWGGEDKAVATIVTNECVE
jgi:hypothetical protein